MEINSIQLLDRETIIRRIVHLKKPPNRRAFGEVTIRDMARYIGVTRETIRLHVRGDPISDSWQIIYSRFFHMLDAGILQLRQVGEGRSRRKELHVVPKPEAPPKRPTRPHIEISDLSMRLRFS